ncbi:MAG: hypothetical protein EBR30_01520 [Cytophagia bacterium]|nr:hypothetical protein [Cytophagia bacterium]
MIEIQEDLNIENMRKRVIGKCWYDKERFPTMKDIAVATGLSERTLNRLGRDYGFPRRTKANIQRYIIGKKFVHLFHDL